MLHNPSLSNTDIEISFEMEVYMRPRPLYTLLITWICLGFNGVGSSESAEYFVATFGRDTHSCAQAKHLDTPVRTIQQGINCATKPGDVVSIKAGTYNEALDIRASGTKATPIVIQPVGNDTVTISGHGTNPGDPYQGLVNFHGAVSYVHLKGLSITGADATTQPSSSAVSAAGGAHHLYFKDITIVGAKDVAMDFSGSAAYITVENADVSRFLGFAGFNAKNGRHIAVIGGKWHDFAGAGNVDGITYPHIVRGLIDGVEVYNMCDGIDIGGSSGLQKTVDIIVRNNHVHDTGGSSCSVGRGITAQGSDIGHERITFYKNLIYDTQGPTFELYKQARNIEYWNNTVLGRHHWLRGGCFGDGALVHDRITVMNNLYGPTRYGPNLMQWNMEDPRNFVADYNLFYNPNGPVIEWDANGNDNGIHCYDPGLTTYRGPQALTAFANATSTNHHSKVVDPSWINPAKHNYALRPLSPAVDAGTFFMTATKAGTRTTVIPVNRDPRRYFVAPGDFYMVAGDTIQIEGVGRVQIAAMTSTQIHVTKNITFARDAGVHIPWNGRRPDIGYAELNIGGASAALRKPLRLHLIR